MQEDFHYYATYCAAYLSGYSHEESLDICYSAQFVDLFSKTFLTKIGAPSNAATTQLQLELMDARTDILGLQDITRIWSSFHFLPYDLYAKKKKRPKTYMNKYRLICGPNGDLVEKTVKLAKDKSLQAVGIAMHVLADTWAHRYFAGTPSLVINNTDGDFFEIFNENGVEKEQKVKFVHKLSSKDDVYESIYTSSVYQGNENSIMNLGHGRAGHLPDYSYIKYRYIPAWNDYREIIKDNPDDYFHAFSQMVYAMRYLRGEEESFVKNRYDTKTIAPYEERIKKIINMRQLKAAYDWKKFGEELSGEKIFDFDLDMYQREYINEPKESREDTFIGKFITAALAQKGMVTDEIYKSGNPIAGFALEKFLKKETKND
jgi:hypothetical protein